MERGRERERENDVERRIWVSPRRHHTPLLNNLSAENFDKQTHRLADRQISFAGPLATPMMAVKTAVTRRARERGRERDWRDAERVYHSLSFF